MVGVSANRSHNVKDLVQVDHEKLAREVGPDYLRLIGDAATAEALDAGLTLGQALRKYKKAVFWSMFLSTSLVMEGYDLVVVSRSSLLPSSMP